MEVTEMRGKGKEPLHRVHVIFSHHISCVSSMAIVLLTHGKEHNNKDTSAIVTFMKINDSI